MTARVAVWQNFEKPVDELKKERAAFREFEVSPVAFETRVCSKGYLDGSLGSRTAAMLAPYSDDPANSGIPRRSEEEMIKMIVERDAAGFQMGLHAIGDKSNRIALDGFQEAMDKNGVRLETGIVISPNVPRNLNTGEFTFETLRMVREHRSKKLKFFVF